MPWWPTQDSVPHLQLLRDEERRRARLRPVYLLERELDDLHDLESSSTYDAVPCST